jgi:hypothetical protein
MDRNVRVGKTPQEIDAKKPLCQTHEFHFDLLVEEMFKELFDLGILGEVYKVANI